MVACIRMVWFIRDRSYRFALICFSYDWRRVLMVAFEFMIFAVVYAWSLLNQERSTPGCEEFVGDGGEGGGGRNMIFFIPVVFFFRFSLTSLYRIRWFKKKKIESHRFYFPLKERCNWWMETFEVLFECNYLSLINSLKLDYFPD